MQGQVVDTPSAAEFMGEILGRVSADDLVVIAGEVAQKSARMQAVAAGPIDPDGLTLLLRQVFTTRRRIPQIFDAVGAELLAASVTDLLHGPAGLAERVDAFDRVCQPVADCTFDLPGELLHFCQPDRYWLWTRWMWDPHVETGALRLVTMEEVDLAGATRGDTYLRVGEAVAFVGETTHAAGFTKPAAGRFGVDVFLAAVYGIYMYTVLRMRMTQEFNRLVPELPALVRRLLGIYYQEA